MLLGLGCCKCSVCNSLFSVFCRCASYRFPEALTEIAGAFKAAELPDRFHRVAAVFQKALGFGNANTVQILHDGNAALFLIEAAEGITINMKDFGKLEQRKRLCVALFKQMQYARRKTGG